MDPDLSALVELQRLDSAIDAARKAHADIPQREAALEAAVVDATAALEAAKQRVADNRTARGAVDKDLAAAQARLAKFKDQTMAVKTNKEFHALQHEMSMAQDEIRACEDRVLEFMMAADDLAARVKAAEAALAETRRDAAAERTKLTETGARLEQELAFEQAERDRVAATLPKAALALFESIRKNRGLAVTPMLDGRCKTCQVRLRPQVAQIVRRNDTIVQCDSCGRVLYYAPPPPTSSDTPAPGASAG